MWAGYCSKHIAHSKSFNPHNNQQSHEGGTISISVFWIRKVRTFSHLSKPSKWGSPGSTIWFQSVLLTVLASYLPMGLLYSLKEIMHRKPQCSSHSDHSTILRCNCDNAYRPEAQFLTQRKCLKTASLSYKQCGKLGNMLHSASRYRKCPFVHGSLSLGWEVGTTCGKHLSYRQPCVITFSFYFSNVSFLLPLWSSIEKN
jgi:hypothetical protein